MGCLRHHFQSQRLKNSQTGVAELGYIAGTGFCPELLHTDGVSLECWGQVLHTPTLGLASGCAQEWWAQWVPARCGASTVAPNPLRAPTQGSVTARAQLQICPALSRSLILTALEVAALLPASTCMAHPSSTACPCPQTPAAGPGRHVGRRWQGHMGYTSPGMAAL